MEGGLTGCRKLRGVWLNKNNDGNEINEGGRVEECLLILFLRAPDFDFLVFGICGMTGGAKRRGPF